MFSFVDSFNQSFFEIHWIGFLLIIMHRACWASYNYCKGMLESNCTCALFQIFLSYLMHLMNMITKCLLCWEYLYTLHTFKLFKERMIFLVSLFLHNMMLQTFSSLKFLCAFMTIEMSKEIISFSLFYIILFSPLFIVIIFFFSVLLSCVVIVNHKEYTIFCIFNTCKVAY